MKSRYLTEYDEEKERRLAREEAAMIAHKEGRAEGRAEAFNEANERVATDMLKDNYPISAIEKISRLSEEAIRELAQSLEITVV